MKFERNIFFLILLAATISAVGQSAKSSAENYLSWSASQAESIGKEMRTNGQVGSSFDFRIIHTDHAINYKLRATLMTPEVIRASARVEQFRNRLSDQQTRELVEEAETGNDLVIIVELDPREGSGVIPLDWRVFLQPSGLKVGEGGAIPGVKSPQLRNVKALAGVFRRDYDYDIFWVAFPLVDKNKKPTIDPNVQSIELLVGIYGKEGRATWKIPSSVREKILSLSKK